MGSYEIRRIAEMVFRIHTMAYLLVHSCHFRLGLLEVMQIQLRHDRPNDQSGLTDPRTKKCTFYVTFFRPGMQEFIQRTLDAVPGCYVCSS